MVEASAGARVRGAAHARIATREDRAASDLGAADAAATDLADRDLRSSLPPPRSRGAATLVEDGVPMQSWAGLPSRRVSADELIDLDPARVGALVVAGNALPLRTGGGREVARADRPLELRVSPDGTEIDPEAQHGLRAG